MPSVVYFVQGGDGGPIKIGITEDVRRRLQCMQSDSPLLLRVLGIIPSAGLSDETALHRRFAFCHLHGEWHEPHPDLLAFIERTAVRVAFPRTPACNPHPLKQYLWTSHVRASDFAAQIQTTASYVSQIVCGQRYPSRKMAHRIEHATGGTVKATDLLLWSSPDAHGEAA